MKSKRKWAISNFFWTSWCKK